MATYNAKTERLAAVNNAKGCTNFGAMAIDGMKAWALKSDGDGENAKSVLYYCSNVDTESEATPYDDDEQVAKGLLGHGNGMTCNVNYLLFACSGKQVVRVPRGFKADWDKAVVIDTQTSISVIAYYKPYQHIIWTDTLEAKNMQRFAIGTITVNGKKGTMTNSDPFYVKTPEKYAHAQDIHYDTVKGLLFLTFNFRTYDYNTSKGELNNNEIWVYDLNVASGTYEGCKLYSPRDIIKIDKRDNRSRYEIESLGLDSNRKIVMACNILVRGKNSDIDAFQRITNITF